MGLGEIEHPVRVVSGRVVPVCRVVPVRRVVPVCRVVPVRRVVPGPVIPVRAVPVYLFSFRVRLKEGILNWLTVRFVVSFGDIIAPSVPFDPSFIAPLVVRLVGICLPGEAFSGIGLIGHGVNRLLPPLLHAPLLRVELLGGDSLEANLVLEGCLFLLLGVTGEGSTEQAHGDN